MLSILFLVISTLVSFGFALPQDLQSVLRIPDPECTTGDGIHMIVIRATTEAPGYGALIAIVKKLNRKLPGSTNESIVYPATGVDVSGPRPIIDPWEYLRSETIGVTNTTIAIQEYSQRCPRSKIALLGYSQGAQVVGDVLCGRNETLYQWSFPYIPPIPRSYTTTISSILQLGDPSNVDKLPWHDGDGEGNGLFPKKDFSFCKDFGDRWQSWCDDKDFFCTKKGNKIAHKKYIEKHQDAMVDFIVKKATGLSSDGQRELR